MYHLNEGKIVGGCLTKYQYLNTLIRTRPENDRVQFNIWKKVTQIIRSYQYDMHIFRPLPKHMQHFRMNYHKLLEELSTQGNRKAMNRNWSNQKVNPALKTKTGNK